ncbi:MAG TPA: glycosyl hydrolase [Chryseosolibacter sp.]|nr:glycosyl hydrolase [Chryseosolibacter sp.]
MSVLHGGAQVLEAENGTKFGTSVSTQRSGYTGSGYVTGFDAEGDKLLIDFSSTRGYYHLYIRYASASGDKYNFIQVNGLTTGSVAFPMSASFNETYAGKIYLEHGMNSIGIIKEWGYVDIDNFRLEIGEPAAIYQLAENLVTPEPSDKADSIYQQLCDLYGKVILSGQYGGDAELNRIQSVSGKVPLIRGFDMMDYSPSRVERGAVSTETEKAIAWHEAGGVVTFCWHWNAPKDLIDQPGKEWWRGFYTDATTFDVEKAMSDPASEEYSLLVRDIDVIAAQLQKLEDAGVPVLWRPLHEAEGKWFWWGAKGPLPCKWLWNLLFDRLVNHHQLNNLIWVWTSTGNPAALDWYPGDDRADMIGADIYLPDGSYGSSFNTFDNIATLYSGRKIIALSENGPIPDPERMFVERAAWSWFCTWGGGFILNGTSNSATHINHVFNHEYTITRDEVDGLDSIVARLGKRRQQIDSQLPVTASEGGMAGFGFYPNPLSKDNDILTLTGLTGRVIVTLLNSHGKVINIQSHHGRNLELHATDWPAGVYFLKVQFDRRTLFVRVIRI